MIMKRSILTVLFLLCAWPLLAVDAEVSTSVLRGKVVDAKTKEPIQYVNVVVRKAGTQTQVKGVVTDQTGMFRLEGLTNGDYTVGISFLGYTTFEKDFTISDKVRSVNLQTVALTEDSQVMNEVVVTGKRSQMRFEIDKKVFNVDQSLATTGGSASEVLGNIPSVEVDNEGQISLRGSTSVTVWINGKASGLTADNRGQILEQIPAENIERVEVITNPSAKYSPEGTAGIINIVLKRNRQAGYYGSVQAGADTEGGYSGSANINYSSGQLEAYAGFGVRYHSFENGGNNLRTNLDDAGNQTSYLNQRSEGDSKGTPLFFRAGATYSPTLKDHITVGGFGMFGDSKRNTSIFYDGDMTGYYPGSERIGRQNSSMNGGNVELGYKREFSKTSSLDIMGSYNSWGMDNTTIYNQRSVFADGHETTSYQQQESDMRMQNWEVQADYVNQFSENSKLEAGYKGTFSRENSPVETFSGADAASALPETQLYNRFYYNQDIQALYATYSGRIGKFGYQAGLRGEYSRINTRSLAYGEAKGDVKPFEKDYFSLFPSVFLSYQLPGDNELQVNYTRRISRPWGGQLNSFVNVTDSTNISYGNPALQPEFSNAFELNYIKNWDKHTFSASLYYRNTNDVIQRISYRDGEVMKGTYENVAESQSAGAEFVAKNGIASFFDLTTTVEFYYYKLDGFIYYPLQDGEPVTGQGSEDFSWNARMIADFTLPYSFSLQLTGRYDARRVIAQGYRKASYSVDAGLRKSFLDRKLSFSVSVRDVFNSRKWHTVTSGSGFRQDSRNWFGGRVARFTLTYSFGNMKQGGMKGRQVQPSDGGGMYQQQMEMGM